MATARTRLEWDQTALLWSLIANVNRDPAQQPKPFLPSDVHPLRTAADYADNREADGQQIAKIKQSYKVNKIHGLSIHRSWQGVSSTPGR